MMMLPQEAISQPQTQNVVSIETNSTFNIEQQLNSLQNIVFNGVRLPLTDLVVVDGELVLEQIECLDRNIPDALETALEILKHQEEIIENAENYAREIIAEAENRADEILEESSILRKAELQAAKIKFDSQRECDRLIESTHQEVEALRKAAIEESKSLQSDADNYAKSVLIELEEKLMAMLAIAQNGRQELELKNRSQANNLYDK